MIPRHLLSELKTLLGEYPVVTVVGPRQAGKTTLVKHFLEGYAYSNLEDPAVRKFASEDPKSYLSQFKGKVIIDEVQRVPELLSYIQIMVDEVSENGRFILTGSHQLELQQAVSQSLAGRTAILNLLPLAIGELSDAGVGFDRFESYCLHGFLPRVYDQSMRPSRAYANYYQTYVERDVKQLVNIKDMNLFEKFLKLIAGRVGQLVDYSSLARDVGVDAKTVKRWLSILEASFILFKLAPYYQSFGKRVVKSPKYYFVDVGLLCYLLGIEEENQVTRDPLVGSIFENLVVCECLKTRLNQGKRDGLYFFRDTYGNEVDVVFENARSLTPIEIKSAGTFHQSFLKPLIKFKEVASRTNRGFLIYSGDFFPETEDCSVIHYTEVRKIFLAQSS